MDLTEKQRDQCGGVTEVNKGEVGPDQVLECELGSQDGEVAGLAIRIEGLAVPKMVQLVHTSACLHWRSMWVSNVAT